MSQQGWQDKAEVAYPENRKLIKVHCRDYVSEVAPEVLRWRNKAAAHFAITDPFDEDSVATLLHSAMAMVAYSRPYFTTEVRFGPSELPGWGLTEVFESLRERLWLEFRLEPLPTDA